MLMTNHLSYNHLSLGITLGCTRLESRNAYTVNTWDATLIVALVVNGVNRFYPVGSPHRRALWYLQQLGTTLAGL